MQTFRRDETRQLKNPSGIKIAARRPTTALKIFNEGPARPNAGETINLTKRSLPLANYGDYSLFVIEKPSSSFARRLAIPR